jgi:chromosome segregation ATPase
MADSISDLLDENQKAAEQLLASVASAKDILQHVTDTFITPLKPHMEKESSRALVDAIQELKTKLGAEASEFAQARDKFTPHFEEIAAKVVELDEHVDDARESLEQTWDTIRKSIESLDAVTKEMEDEEDEHHHTLLETIEALLGEILQHHAMKTQVVQQLHDATEAAEGEVDDLAQQHKQAIEELEHALAEKSDALQQAFRDFADNHTQQEEETATAISEAVEHALQELRQKLGDELPESLNTGAEETVLGPFSEMSDSATTSHQSLNEAVEQILEKLREVSTTLEPVHPVLNTIETIG